MPVAFPDPCPPSVDFYIVPHCSLCLNKIWLSYMAVYSQLLSPAFLVINSQTSTIYLVIAGLELPQEYIHSSINIFILIIWESSPGSSSPFSTASLSLQRLAVVCTLLLSLPQVWRDPSSSADLEWKEVKWASWSSDLSLLTWQVQLYVAWQSRATGA